GIRDLIVTGVQTCALPILRCFVNGQFVGELPLAVCAQRNGVATGSLDVGLDPSGALAAASNAASSGLTPLPSQAPPQSLPLTERSEERRVGKERRARWRP